MTTRERMKSLACALVAALAIAVPAVASAQSPATVVILVRHGEKSDEPGGDPALSAAGEARAHALAEVLRDAKVAAVLTTPFKRTMQTAAPVASASGVTPVQVPVTGGLAAYAKAVSEMIRGQYAGQTVVVVGHSNTIPAVIAALGGPKMSDLCEGEYSRLFTLIVDGSAGARLVRSSYGAPDLTDASGCRAMMTPTR